MYYVIAPVYEYEDLNDIQTFDTVEKAIEFINDDLKQNKTSTFKNTADDYFLIEGHKVNLKTVEITTMVERA